MYTAVGFKIINVYIQMRHTARDGCVLLIDDVNDEFTNSPRERAGPLMDNNVFKFTATAPVNPPRILSPSIDVPTPTQTSHRWSS